MQNLYNRLHIYVYSGFHIFNIYLSHIIYVNFVLYIQNPVNAYIYVKSIMYIGMKAIT